MRPWQADQRRPSGSYFVEHFRQVWRGGPFWTEKLMAEKRATADRLDQLDLPFEHRERLVGLLSVVTTLHLLEWSRQMFSMIGAMMINLFVLYDLPWLIITLLGGKQWPGDGVRIVGMILRLLLLYIVQGVLLWSSRQHPMYRVVWSGALKLMHGLYGPQVDQLRIDLSHLQAQDRTYPRRLMERVVRLSYPAS